MKNFILASGSPRRAQLLSDLNLDFECILPDEEKNISKIHFSYELIEDIAQTKVLSVYKKVKNDDVIIIGADTVVVLEDKILTKPKDKQDAINILKLLSGNTHFVVTSHCIKKGEKELVESVTSYVTFNNLSDEDIKNYVEIKQPLDKAGAYGIQELPENFVKKVDGDFNNIIGLSTDTILKMLKTL